MGLSSLLNEHANHTPEKAALEDGARTVTYGALWQGSNAVAANLWTAGIRPGHTVALCLPDSADHLILLCGLLRLGAIIWPLDAGLDAKTVNALASAHKAKAVIAPPTISIATGLTHLTQEELLRPTSVTFAQPEQVGTAPFALIQSSGTTGRPKFVHWSRDQLLDTLRADNPTCYWRDGGRCLSFVRMSLNSGCRYNLRFLLAGATVVINHATNLEEMAHLINAKQIGYVIMIPAQLGALANFAGDGPLLFPHHPVLATQAGASSPEQLLLARERLTPNVHEYYGTNECGLVTVSLPGDQDTFPGTAGRLLNGFEAEIVDEMDSLLPPGKIGHLRLRGANFPKCYLNDPVASEKQFRLGWHYPGDLAAINENGLLFYKGRIDDCINNNGVKFYPVEVERALLTYPGVLEAAAFGWPHPIYGEVAVAVVVGDGTVSGDGLQLHGKQNLPPYKQPRYIMFADALPKTATGKVLKSDLKERLRAKLERSPPI